MDTYKETFETWNKVASLYQDKFMNLTLYDETYDYFCKTLDINEPRILEIGCGPGNISKYLLSKRPDFKIEGIDAATNMIELAKKNNPTANFKVMDGRQIDTLETKFDAIVCGFCLPYLSGPDSSKLILDCKNTLTDRGILYLSFVEGNANKSGFQVGSTGDRIYFHYHSLAHIEKTLLDNYFEPVKLFNINYKQSDKHTEVHTILIARKKTNA